MKNYIHIFFDLDHTLWDYDRNVQESLQELFQLYALQEAGIASYKDFHRAFLEVNYGLWGLYNLGKIDKANLRKERFKKIFEHLGADGQLVPLDMEEDFIHRTSTKKNLFPFSIEMLTYLKDKYKLHVITNGFNESQALKLNTSGLHAYFDLVVTSETTGHRKPDKQIFEYTMAQLQTTARDCIMIGDNLLSDILGAQNAQIDQVFFNPDHKACEFLPDGRQICPTYTINCLSELRSIL